MLANGRVDVARNPKGRPSGQADDNGNGIGNAREVFADGFESGDTSAWSSTVP